MLISCRTCRACGQSRQLSDFWPEARRKDGYQAYCKDCNKAKRRSWALLHPERIKAFAAKAKPQVYGDKQREYHRKRYLENKPRILALNKAWWRNNPEKARIVTLATTNRRRLVKLGCEGSHTHEEWLSLCGRYERLCARCAQPHKLTKDHIVPLISGGTDYISNIQPLCKPCNSSKGTSSVNYLGR